MFTVKIETLLRPLHFQVQWIERANQLDGQSNNIIEKPGEQLTGQLGKLTTLLVQKQPNLLLFDLANEQIPWQKWITVLKSSAATRRFPILCFGPHIQTDKIKQAKQVGADAVVARSRLVTALPELINKYARLPKTKAINQACSQPLASLAIKGIELYNTRSFFDAHEELEQAWLKDKGEGRNLYRAILQLAVAYLQVERQNYNGAIKMLLRVQQWLWDLPDMCRGIDINQIRNDVNTLYTTLTSLGENNLSNFDWQQHRPIEIHGNH